MPPRVKIKKEDIVHMALHLLRGNGEGAVNARSIAAALGCSTQPIFSNYATMEHLERAVLSAAYAQYLDFLQGEVQRGQYPPYKAMGMAYVRFAKQERELFKLLFMRDRSDEDTSPSVDFEGAVQMIAKANGVSPERARLMHMEVWSCVHGIATMLATSFLSLPWELISTMLTDVYQGIRARHLSEENENGRNSN